MKSGRYYKAIPAELKFQAVLEMLAGDKTLAELSRSYGVHTNTLLKWKACFLERGAEIFDGSNRSYREAVLDAYIFYSLAEVRQLTKDWLRTYNTIWPHEALRCLPPHEFADKHGRSFS